MLAAIIRNHLKVIEYNLQHMRLSPMLEVELEFQRAITLKTLLFAQLEDYDYDDDNVQIRII